MLNVCFAFPRNKTYNQNMISLDRGLASGNGFTKELKNLSPSKHFDSCELPPWFVRIHGTIILRSGVKSIE